jgi:hypothetical protein
MQTKSLRPHINEQHVFLGQTQAAVQKDEVQNMAQEPEEHNQVQSILPEIHGLKRRGSLSPHRSVGVLPQPEPEEETKPFILDLKNFPDLANADISSQNPNIQVRCHVGCLWLRWRYEWRWEGGLLLMRPFKACSHRWLGVCSGEGNSFYHRRSL